MAAEMVGSYLWQKKAGLAPLPRWVTMLLTQAVFQGLAALFWFPPYIQSGLMDKIMNNLDGMLMSASGGAGVGVTAAVDRLSSFFAS